MFDTVIKQWLLVLSFLRMLNILLVIFVCSGILSKLFLGPGNETPKTFFSATAQKNAHGFQFVYAFF